VDLSRSTPREARRGQLRTAATAESPFSPFSPVVPSIRVICGIRGKPVGVLDRRADFVEGVGEVPGDGFGRLVLDLMPVHEIEYLAVAKDGDRRR
jgi:hypothetical protein